VYIVAVGLGMVEYTTWRLAGLIDRVEWRCLVPADPQAVERIVVFAQQLSPEDRMLVMRRIAQTLGRSMEGRPHYLQFGKYKGYSPFSGSSKHKS
jgi:predicted lysophospholipase L1 biosynthesis ABC-type transport system permease subunit